MIQLAKPYFDGRELENVKACLDSGYVSEGPMAAKFSGQVKELVGSKFAIPVTSCTAALWLSLKALHVGPGDDVVVPAYTYPATANVVEDLGANVVFCDVDELTYNARFDQIVDAVTPHTKAVIPVHLFGLMSTEMARLKDFCEENEIFIIEDAACSMGAKFKGMNAGTVGDIGCYAFHARKVVTTGEGGMCVTDNPVLDERLRLLKRFGWDGKRDFMLPGLNFKMADILAAVGSAQMDKVGQIIEGRRGVAKYYSKVLKDMDNVMVPFEPDGAYHLYQAYVCQLDEDVNRDKVIEMMRSRGVECQVGTYNVAGTTAFKDVVAEVPVSERLFRQSLALPCWYGLKKTELELVVKSLKEVI